MADIPYFDNDESHLDDTQIWNPSDLAVSIVKKMDDPNLRSAALHRLSLVDPGLKVSGRPMADLHPADELGVIAKKLGDLKDENKIDPDEYKMAAGMLLGLTVPVPTAHLEKTQPSPRVVVEEPNTDDEDTVITFRGAPVSSKISRSMGFTQNSAVENPLMAATLRYMADQETRLNPTPPTD